MILSSKRVMPYLMLYFLFFLAVQMQSQELQINANNYLTLSLKDSNTMLFQWRNTGSKNGWVSIGIGGDLMEKVDMHVITWKTGSQPYSFVDYWSRDYDDPTEDIFAGGTADLNFVSYNTNAVGDRILVYSRLLNTGDKYDNVISNGSNKLVSAWSPFDNNMTKHGAYVGIGSFTVNTSNLTVSASIGRYTLWELHGIGLLIIWSILNALSYFTIRLFKHSSLFVWIHRISGFVITIITIVFTAIAIATNVEGPSNDHPDFNIHAVVGFIIAGSAIVMLLTGVAQGFLIYGKNLMTDKIYILKLVHKIIGHILTYACIASSITGGWVLYQS